MRSLFYIGAPDWDGVHTQISFKYASERFACSRMCSWVLSAFERIRDGFPSAPDTRFLVDVRYWDRLNVGDIPGIPHWHFDCYNNESDPRSENELHRLYFFGADCEPEFQGHGHARMGYVWEYPHTALHRITAARAAGPRLLIRISRTQIYPVNQIHTPFVTR